MATVALSSRFLLRAGARDGRLYSGAFVTGSGSCSAKKNRGSVGLLLRRIMSTRTPALAVSTGIYPGSRISRRWLDRWRPSSKLSTRPCCHVSSPAARVRESEAIPSLDELWVMPPEEGPEGGTFLLVDCTPVVYRAHFQILNRVANGQLSCVNDGDGTAPTVFAALGMVVTLLELMPSHVAICFDSKEATFRHKLFPEYKGQRPGTPDAVRSAIRVLQPALTAMGLPVVLVNGVEADDVIGILAQRAASAGMKVRIASPDKDFFQLLSPNIRLLRPARQGSKIVSFGCEDFQAMFGGLAPEQFVDFLALMGDKADNISGVVGIGPKWAQRLLLEYGSLEALMEQRASVKTKSIREALMRDRGEVFLYQRLVRLLTNIDDFPETSWPDFQLKAPMDGGDQFWNLVDLLKCHPQVVLGPLESRIQKLWQHLNI